MKKWEALLFCLLIGGAFFVRLYRLNSPLADWHSWRQADTSAVSRNFVKHGFDLLHPTFDDLSNVPSGLDNPKGYRFVEFPIYNVLQASSYRYIGQLSLEEWGRMITIVMSLFSTLFIFLLARKYIGTFGAFFAAGFFAFLPYNIYYSRVILPDPSMVTATLACIYFFDLWADESAKRKIKSLKEIVVVFLLFLASLVFGMTALLLKPYAAFFFLPLFVIAWNTWKWRVFKKPLLYIFILLIGLPLVWWRLWMKQFPEGIPVNAWLFNGGNIRFTGAFFYWIFAERISKLLLGYWGIVVVMMAFLSKRRSLPFLISFVVSSLSYVTIIARGNVQHDYYQILIIPTLAFLFGFGADMLSSFLEKKKTGFIILAVSSIFMVMFGWYQVRDYFNINNPSIVIAGKAVDTLVPAYAKVIALYDGDTSFLYQTNRQGWASLEKDVPVMVRMGADYMVLVNPTPNDFAGFGKEYKTIASAPQYLILDLHKKP